MVTVSYHDSVNVLQGRIAPGPGPFGRLEWFALLEHAAGPAPLVVVASEGDAAAALVLRRRGRVLEALTNWYSFTWQPLTGPAAPVAPLLTALARDLKRQAGRISLSPLPDEDGSAAMLEQAFRSAGWITFRQPCDTNHVLPVRGRGFGDYLASLPGPLRTTLKRKSGKVETRILTSFDQSAWQAYEDVYSSSWKPEEGDPALLRRFAQGEGRAGHLRLGLALHQGEVVAAQFWTVERGTAFIHKLAHREKARTLSAGTVLTAALMRHVIDEDRVTLVDFGTGDDPYKADWMEQLRPRFRLECFAPLAAQHWPALLKQGARHLAPGQRGD